MNILTSTHKIHISHNLVPQQRGTWSFGNKKFALGYTVYSGNEYEYYIIYSSPLTKRTHTNKLTLITRLKNLNLYFSTEVLILIQRSKKSLLISGTENQSCLCISNGQHQRNN